MKKLFFLLLILINTSLFAQVITTTPALPLATDAITIHFNAEEGTGGLADYTGDIYAHIGLITDESTGDGDWKYVKAEWGENKPECQLTRESPNAYTLEISPNLYAYFGCPTTEKILKIAMVFRGETGSPEGKASGGSDIFAIVYEEGLNVSFARAASYVLDDADADISFTSSSSVDAKLEIIINGTVKKTVENTNAITYNQQFSAGDYTVVSKATTATQVAYDTVSVCALGTSYSAARPSGLHDGINYDGTSVTFVLYAPYKESVLLRGDFNDWIPSNDYLLAKDGDYWWITVENLILGEEYAFQYLVDQNIAIADPYSEKVLDPWNDKYINANTYPNLKAYPTEQADGIVGVIAPGAEEYNWDTDDFTPPTNDKLVVYELLIRDFFSSQDIKDVMGRLDYLEELGVTAIELMPVNEFEGNSSWGYNPSFFFAFDKNYGSKNDYKAFVDSCHARGMAVIMDMVLNHAFFQCPLVTLYFDADASEYGQPTAQNPWFNQESPNTDYSWGADFNHDSPQTEQFVDRVTEYWMTEYKINGFRFDFTKGFTNTGGSGWAYDQSRIDNLKRMYDEIVEVNPEAYVILEHFCDNNEEKELANYGMMVWGNNNHAYMQSTMGYNTEASIASISHLDKGWDYPNLMAYQESHDEERMMFKTLSYGNNEGAYDTKDLSTALDRQELAAAFFLTVPGPKMIWQFGELGYGYSINACTDGSLPSDDQCRTAEKPIHWEYYAEQDRRDVYDVYAKLNKLRANYEVFSSWDYTISESTTPFTKRINIYHDNADVAVVGNFDVITQRIEPNFSSTGKWYEFFADDSIEVTSLDMDIELQPGEYKLYSTLRMATNVTDVDLKAPELSESSIVVFPNPAIDMITIENNKTISAVSLFSISGQLIQYQIVNAPSSQLDVSGLHTGTYLLQVIGDGYSSFTKVMIR